MAVARPDCIETKAWAKKALQEPVLEPPSVRLADDVREIASRERNKFKGYAEPTKTVLSRVAIKQDKVVTITEAIIEHPIASDNEDKTLRKVKK
uniref:EF-Ts n=2 Tax=Rhabditophanes sp. KR3021 TaxID=114890 RepID=A0AC35UAF7_9BILA